MSLNVPDTRQSALAQRLQGGQQIVAIEAAQEFGVSIDTIRRDILALEAEGRAQRVRGGAVPVAAPSEPIHTRLMKDESIDPGLIQAAVNAIGDAATLIVDGGITALSVVERLPLQEGRLVVTPSPWVAIACQERGVDVFMLGGQLRPQGGIATGELAQGRIAAISGDIAILGACGIDAEFGLSSDDHAESLMKQAMRAAARRTFVVTDHSKLGRRARHQTLPMTEIDQVITNAASDKTSPLIEVGVQVTTV